MAYARGKFGIEYSSGPAGDEPHRTGLVLAVLFALAAISFFSARGCLRHRRAASPPAGPAEGLARPLAKSEPEVRRARPAFFGIFGGSGGGAAAPAEAVQTAAVPPAPSSARAMPPTGAADRLLEAAEGRPVAVRSLLQRLVAAEREGNTALAINAIEKLRDRPDAADLDDALARRLGVLNLALLLSSRSTTWTTTDSIGAGDTLPRLAREHGTTVAAVLKMNGIADARRIRAGRPLRVLEHPRFALVLHRRTLIADLSLNGKFFRRYDVNAGAETKTGAYKITREEGTRSLLRRLGARLSDADLAELEMLMPPGASFLVTDP